MKNYYSTVELEHNKGKIPQNDLKKIQKYLWANREIIIARWYQFFGMQEKLIYERGFLSSSAKSETAG